MKKYLTPLGVFAGGHLVILIIYLFLGSIRTATDQLATDSAAMAPTFWGWGWIVSGNVVAFLIVLFLELLVLYGTARAFLAVR